MRPLKEGVSVLFFPEGTRTTDGALASFKVSNFQENIMYSPGSIPWSLALSVRLFGYLVYQIIMESDSIFIFSANGLKCQIEAFFGMNPLPQVYLKKHNFCMLLSMDISNGLTVFRLNLVT